jgi:hypothetical protein
VQSPLDPIAIWRDLLKKNMMISTYFYRKAFLVTVTLNVLLAPASCLGSVNQLLRFSWSYDTSVPDLAGYILYQNSIPIADVHDPTALDIDQEVILESGTNSFTMTAFDGTGNESPHSVPYVIEVPREDASGNIPPLARIQPSATLGEASFFVDFDAAGSLDYDGDVVGHSWDFGDGSGAQGGIVGHTFDRAGV